MPDAIIYGWLNNRSKGSILVEGIAHAARNAAAKSLPDLAWQVLTLTAYAAALLMVLVDRMWKKLPAGNAAVYSSTSPPA